MARVISLRHQLRPFIIVVLYVLAFIGPTTQLAVAAPVTRIQFDPLELTIIEGQSDVVNVNLDEPIIAPEPEDEYVSIELEAETPGLVTFDTSPVVFESAEWNTTKDFTITAVDDEDVNEDTTITITGTATSGSEYYNSFATTMEVTIIDNDGPEDDLNGDGTPDSEQPNMGGYYSNIAGTTVAMDVGDGCELTTDDMARESDLATQDETHDYTYGLFEIEGDCGTPGFTTTIRLYYYNIDADGMELRKYNPETGVYTTVEDAVITETTIYGNTVTVVTYELTDGGPLDTDGLVDGQFADPAGLASALVAESATASLADTGAPQHYIAMIALCLIAAGLYRTRHFKTARN